MKNAHSAAQPDRSVTLPVVASLDQLLASSYVLMANTQFAHWNVEGEHFFALHAAFQAHYENLFAAVDEVAERIRALGAPASGGLSGFAARAGFAEFSRPLSARDLVASLVAGHQKVAKDAAAVRDAAGAANDLESQDLAIGRIQWHEKTIWMLRSFLK